MKRSSFAALALFFALIFAARASADELGALSGDFVPRQAIVFIKTEWNGGPEISNEDAIAAAERVAREVGGYVWDIDILGSRNIGSVSAVIAHEELETDELIERLTKSPSVLFAEPNAIIALDRVPDDTDYNNSPNYRWNMEAIGAPEAWDLVTGADDIYVAVIDSGLSDHADVEGNVAWDLARNFYGGSESAPGKKLGDDTGHGSHVAGTIGARGNNRLGVAGVSWNVKIIPIRVFGTSNTTSSSYIAKGVSYVTSLLKQKDPPKIAAVNMSLGGYSTSSISSYLSSSSSHGYYLSALADKSQIARPPLVAAAAGNDGLEHGVPFPNTQATKGDGRTYERISKGMMHFPSSASQNLDNLISVASISRESGTTPATYRYAASDFSNWSKKTVDIAAPGGRIWSLKNASSGYDYKSGTSMATPHVAGAAALLAARMDQNGLEWDGATLKKILTSTTDSSINPENTWAKNGGQNDAQAPMSNTVGSYELSKNGLLRIDRAIAHADLQTKVRSIGLTLGNSKIQVGTSTSIAATVKPDQAANKSIEWSISPSIATIVSTGAATATITGVSTGTATITARAKDGSGATASIAITVEETPSGHVHSFATRKQNAKDHWMECECGEKIDVEPHSSTEWQRTSTSHKKICDTCSEVFDEGEHAPAAGASWNKDASEHSKLCEACGQKILAAAHSPGSEVHSDGTGHWNECVVCGEKVNKAAHSAGSRMGADSVDHWKLCSTCSWPVYKTPHTPRSYWIGGPTSHWKECSTSGCPFSGRLNEAPHDFVNGRCTVCNFINKDACPHVWHPSAQYDDTMHWKVCSICLTEADHAPHSMAWIAEDASHHLGCAACAYTTAYGVHSYDAYGFNTIEHWLECSTCGSAADRAPHTIGDGGWCLSGCGYRSPITDVGVEHKIGYPNGTTWSSVGDMSFTITGSLADLVAVDLDGHRLESGWRVVDVFGARAAGSFVIALDDELLRTLEPGYHSLTIVMTGGTADGGFVIPGAQNSTTPPSGGGSGGSGGGGCAAGAASIALVIAMIYKRKR